MCLSPPLQTNRVWLFKQNICVGDLGWAFASNVGAVLLFPFAFLTREQRGAARFTVDGSRDIERAVVFLGSRCRIGACRWNDLLENRFVFLACMLERVMVAL